VIVQTQERKPHVRWTATFLKRLRSLFEAAQNVAIEAADPVTHAMRNTFGNCADQFEQGKPDSSNAVERPRSPESTGHGLPDQAAQNKCQIN
jgi:hypothetical protein